MGRPVVHFELWSKNPEGLSNFYAKVFDWNIRHVPELSYHLVDTNAGGQGIGGGIFTPKEGPWPGNLAFYIDVDDLEAYNAKVRECGGTVIVERQDVPGVGSFSLFADPDGRVLGCWKQDKGGP